MIQRTPIYQPGDQVSLVSPSPTHVDLRPGDVGIVLAVSPDQSLLHIAWDRGGHAPSHTAVELIEPLRTAHRWAHTLASVATAGSADGRRTADWWACAALGDLAPVTNDGDPDDADHAGTGTDHNPTGHADPYHQAPRVDARLAYARRVLAHFPNADATVLRMLHAPGSGTAVPATAPDWYTGAVPAGALAWDELSETRRQAATRAYLSAVGTAVLAGVARHCLLVDSPTGDGRDVSHLSPAGLRIGDTGVFSGAWLSSTMSQPGPDRYVVGYVGTYAGAHRGGVVFDCDRPVAEAIVSRRQNERAGLRARLAEAGVAAEELDAAADQGMIGLAWDGAAILIDPRATSAGMEPLTRIEPDAQGRYQISDWGWEAVDPYTCDRIIGTIPAPDGQPASIPLIHAPAVRVPHDRLRARPLTAHPLHQGIGVVALEWDGQPVAVIQTAGIPAVQWTDKRFGPAELDAYAAASTWNGQPMDAELALVSLLEEAAAVEMLVAAAADGATLARLLDAADVTVLDLDIVWPAPRTTLAAVRLGQQIAARHPHPVPGGTWQLWTGSSWLEVATTPTNSPGLTAEDGGWAALPGWLLDTEDPLPALDPLTGEQLVELAATHGILLTPDQPTEQVRARIRAVLRPRPTTTDPDGEHQ